MIFHRTKDADAIRAIATNSKVWPTLVDDLSPTKEKWAPIVHDGIWYVLAYSNERELAGMFVFFPENSITWQIHVCMLPQFRGLGALAMREAFAWIWKQTPCRRITGSVPVWNGPAVLCAIGAGMQAFGVNRHSSIKFSRLHHQILFGISKPAEKAA